MGRLTRDPETKYTQGEKSTCVTKYSIAVNRIGKKDEADFINVTAFGKAGEFAEKYFKKGQQNAVTGRVQTGNYTNKDGQKVYTFDVIAENQFFASSKSESDGSSSSKPEPSSSKGDGFMNIPDGIDEELPFN
jgi:single-strand DNA-binding protein